MGKNICKADQLRTVDPTLSTYLAQAGVSMESVRDLETHKTTTKGINIVTFLGNISANKTRLLTVCQCDQLCDWLDDDWWWPAYTQLLTLTLDN